MHNPMRNISKAGSIVVLAIAAILTIAACKSAQQSGSEGYTLKQQQFEEALKKRNAVLVDVRTPREYDSAHIDNSVLADWRNKEAFMNVVNGLDPKNTYLLYCRSGRRSAEAADTLRKLGFAKVYDLYGGIEAWRGPVVKNKQ
jgi:rhodanese-related sulfurtransferase